MAQIPLTGPFSMADINAEWALGNNLGSYRGARTDIGFLPNVPNPLSYSDFRGRRKAFVLDIIITTPTPNINLRSLAVSYGWDEIVPLTMTVRNRSVVYSNSTGLYALDTDQDFPAGSVLNWYNNDLGADALNTGTGIVAGRGGNGGQGGSAVVFGGTSVGGNGNSGFDGGHGGPAMLARWPINIWNYGAIGGGGGGGGGAGGAASIYGNWLFGTNSSGGGGGGGGGYGVGGPQNFIGVTGPTSTGNPGGNGSWWLGGAGGSSSAGIGIAVLPGTLIYGGNGGSLGQPGGVGGSASDVGYDGLGNAGGTFGNGGNGGLPGRAVLGSGAIWQVLGTIYDGNTAPFFSNGGNLGAYTENTFINVNITALDHDGDTMSFFSTEIPAGLTLTNVSNGLATLSGNLPNIGDTVTEFITLNFNIGVGDSRGASRAQLYTIRVNNPDYIPPPPPDPPPFLSCFPEDALVTMSDYTTKRISEIQPGDLLIGGRGEINEVIALDITKLGNRPLWVINDDHRTTAEHRHLTTEGWASIEPSRTWAEHEVEFPVIYKDGIRNRKMLKFIHGTPLHTLEIGMTFDTLNGNVPFYSLRKEEHDPDTNVYSLVMSGSHTFIVNGYTVSGWATDADFDYNTWMPRGNTNE